MLFTRSLIPLKKLLDKKKKTKIELTCIIILHVFRIPMEKNMFFACGINSFSNNLQNLSKVKSICLQNRKGIIQNFLNAHLLYFIKISMYLKNYVAFIQKKYFFKKSAK